MERWEYLPTIRAGREKWLGDLAGGTTWVDEMKNIRRRSRTTPLYPIVCFDLVFIKNNMIY